MFDSSARKRLVALATATVVAACSGKDRQSATADSSLARDLALASAQPANPMFQDTAIAPSPETKPAARSTETPTPVKRRPQPKPVAPPPREPVVQQQAPQPAPTPATVATAPAPEPARAVAEIGSGTGIGLTSGSKVCSSALPGEKLVATLNDPVSGTNGANLPAGSTAVLEVASVSGEGENATINLRVRAIVVGDRTYNVSANVASDAAMVRTKVQNPDGNADKKKVIGGAIAGAILGQVIGHSTKGTVIGAAAGAATGAAVAKAGEKWESCLPAGAQLRLTLNAPLVMS